MAKGNELGSIVGSYMNKDELQNLYITKQLTTRQIALQANVHRSTVSNWLHKYNIPARSKQAIYEANAKIRLTRIQKDFLIGTLLGDGHIQVLKSKRLARFSASHSTKQRDYMEWKAEILSNIASPIKTYTVFNKQVQKEYEMCNLVTKGTTDILDLHGDFYDGKSKVIRDNISDYLISPQSLAIWYMDDGSRRGNRMTLCTDSFSYEEHCVLQKTLLDNFGLEVKISKYKDGFRLVFGATKSRKFSKLIEGHVVKSMSYKII